jgi:NAD+ kinase
MTHVGFVTHPRRDAAVAATASLRSSLEADGVETTLLPDHGDRSAGAGDLTLVVSVGGDGTFLRAAVAAAETGCPVLGVKVGRLGFLTEVDPDEASALIESVLAGTARIEERLAITVESLDGAVFAPQWGLNEVMVEKQSRHRLIRLAVNVDGAYVTTFSADGVIVASPTGSTAYSFSARGPIVSPEVDSLVLTPIAAHMVFDRSFVLGPGSQVELEVLGEESGILSADGRQSIELPVGSRVRIRASSRPARLVRREGAPGFLSLVREKFKLAGDPDEGRDEGRDVGAGD